MIYRNLRFQWNNRGVNRFFQNSMIHIKILGVKKMTRSHFHYLGPKNVTRHRRPGHPSFAHPWDIKSHSFSLCKILCYSLHPYYDPPPFPRCSVLRNTHVLHQAGHKFSTLKQAAELPALNVTLFSPLTHEIGFVFHIP
jgi:hypothetical protein